MKQISCAIRLDGQEGKQAMESIIIEIDRKIRLYRRSLYSISECINSIQKTIDLYCEQIGNIDTRIATETTLYKIALYRLHKVVCKYEKYR